MLHADAENCRKCQLETTYDKHWTAWQPAKDKDIKQCKAAAWGACRPSKLTKICKSSLPGRFKLRLFAATMESVLLYGCEAWKVKTQSRKTLPAISKLYHADSISDFKKGFSPPPKKNSHISQFSRILIQHVKCILMNTNKPSIGPVVVDSGCAILKTISSNLTQAHENDS